MMMKMMSHATTLTKQFYEKKKYFKKTYFITFQFLIITLQPETLPPIFHKIKTLPEEQKKKKNENFVKMLALGFLFTIFDPQKM